MNPRLIWIGGGALALIVLAVGVGLIGNVGVRRIQSGNAITLNLSEPAVPGVRTVLSWTLPEQIDDQLIEVRVRTVTGEAVVGKASLSDKKATIVFPCAMPTTNGSVSLVSVESSELITWRRVEVLPPGQDCF